MDCHEVQKRLPVDLDSDLSEEQRLQIQAHLATCIPCQKEVRRLEASWQVLGRWREIEPSPYFKQRFWSRIADLDKNKQSKGWWGWRIAWVPAGSLAAVLLLILTWILWSSTQKDGDLQVAPMNQQSNLLEFAATLDLLEHKDLLLEIELLEDFDLLLALEEDTKSPNEEG
ncbi:MAG: zf-HC2 domain-containing protein [Nitrospira sp.]|nr:zf-HC2 domain-containing protein [Nitrospira sp.]